MSDRRETPLPIGRSGHRSGPAGLVVRESPSAKLYTLLARRGAAEALSARIGHEFGVRLPRVPRVAIGTEVSFISSGPDHWLVEATGDDATGHARLAAAVEGLAALVDQSDSRIRLDLAGPRVRDVLAKGVPIDLDPAVFGVGDAAVTAVAHIGVQIWQVDAAPLYRIAVPRSYFGSFWHWLAESAAEYGCAVREDQAGPA